MKCSLCLGHGKFEEYTCYKCGGSGEYLWIEEMVGIDPKRKCEYIRKRINEDYDRICEFFESYAGDSIIDDIIDIEMLIYRNILFKFKNKKIIFDFGWDPLWIKLHPKDRRFQPNSGVFVDENGKWID